MAQGFTNVEEQIRHLQSIVACIDHTALIEETNKCGVIWCEDRYTANLVRLNAERDEYRVYMRKGLKSNHWYVSAYY